MTQYTFLSASQLSTQLIWCSQNEYFDSINTWPSHDKLREANMQGGG